MACHSKVTVQVGLDLMFIVQTRRAKRTRKYAWWMAFAYLVLTGGLAALFSMHLDALPPSKADR